MQIQATVRRPDGTVETVNLPETVEEWQFEQISQATRKAGRGEIIGWTPILTPAEEARVEDTLQMDEFLAAAAVVEAERQQAIFERRARRTGRGW